MTEERFTVTDHNEFAEGDIIYYDNGEEMGWLDVCDKLNEYEKENKNLQQFRDNYMSVCGKNFELEEEIDQLKQQLKTKVIVNKQYEELKRLKEENDKLKLQLELYKELYPSGEWITELTTEEAQKELKE